MVSFRKRFEQPPNWLFRPVTLLTIWILLALLIIINGLYEAKRAKDNLYSLLLNEGTALITGLERSVQNSFSSLSAIEAFPEVSSFLAPPNFWLLEEAIVDLILEIAFRLDQELKGELPPESQLRKLAAREQFSSLQLILAEEKGLPPSFCLPLLEGKSFYAIERQEKAETGQMKSLSVAVARKYGKGILIVNLNEDNLHFYRRRVILQGVIEEWVGKGEIKYITFQGEDFYIWADTNPTKIGHREEEPYLKILFQAAGSPPEIESQKKSGALEVAKVIDWGEEKRVALRLGLSTDKVEEIIAADRRNIFLFSLFLLIFGGAGVTLIYRSENRHLTKLRELEEKIHQSEKLSSLANLAAAVAHEIRNPLNAISMAIQRLQREFTPTGKAAQSEYFRFTDVLRGEVKRVNEIIEQFLFFARPAQLHLTEVQIADILKDLLLIIREPAEQQKVNIEEEINPHLPLLKLDRRRLQEALWNLTNNALQAMPDGGNLKIAVRLSGEEVLVEISDTGQGIPPENLQRIFDYYFTTKEKGMGLGLPLAHKIIKEHGGKINVISKLGKGTTFQIFLPLNKGRQSRES